MKYRREKNEEKITFETTSLVYLSSSGIFFSFFSRVLGIFKVIYNLVNRLNKLI